MSIAERLLTTLWVGGLWVIGYVAAPTLFATLEDTALAGDIAGELFTSMAWLGLACGLLLAGIQLIRHRRAVLRAWRFWVVLSMLGLTILGEFGIRTWMASVSGTEAFAAWHGLAQGLFLAVALLGLALVVASPNASR